MTDYVVFIHGVNTREVRETPHYADALFTHLQKEVGHDLTLKSIPLYWGDVNSYAEQDLLKLYKDSPCWPQLFFQNLREKQLLQFTGDAALFISRCTGMAVVEELKKQLKQGLEGYNANTDRLHLITHSMGTVILFDILFSKRWDYDRVSLPFTGAEEMRDLFFGLPPNEQTGILLCSITTMGSPIDIYSLMMCPETNMPKTHDITDRLENMLQAINTRLKIRLPWRNFIHPADIIAFPLARLLPEMLDQSNAFFDIKDILTAPGIGMGLAGSDGSIANLHLLSNTMSLQAIMGMNLPDILKKAGYLAELAQLMLYAGSAHGSYWTEQIVVNEIATMIKTVAQQVQLQQAPVH